MGRPSAVSRHAVPGLPRQDKQSAIHWPDSGYFGIPGTPSYTPYFGPVSLTSICSVYCYAIESPGFYLIKTKALAMIGQGCVTLKGYIVLSAEVGDYLVGPFSAQAIIKYKVHE
jgi:hypothetical protein